MAIIDSGVSTPGKANVDANFNLQVNTPGYMSNGTPQGGGPENGPAFFSENDPGTATGVRTVASPETDDDYRLRVASDVTLDTEAFNYTAQNTGKHQLVVSTMSAIWGTTGISTNAGNINTVNTGLTLGTYATFPITGTQVTYFETELSFNQEPPTNVVINFGGFIRGAGTAYTPLDGVYFQLANGVWNGVMNQATIPILVPLAVDASLYVPNDVRQYIVAIHPRHVEWWIDNVLVGSSPQLVTNGQPCTAAALPWSLSHSNIVGAASVANFQVNVRNYSVSVGGAQIADAMSVIGSRMYGSYQGLSGGTMGSLANMANAVATAPTAFLPTNSTTPAGSLGLGGQFWETDTLAVNTDGIICSYAVSAATAFIAGRRLRIVGVKISSFIQTTLTGGGYNAVWSLAFGSTGASLATAESAQAKAPRRVPLGTNAVAANAAALTKLDDIWLDMGAGPAYVNPGEYVAVVKKKIGTAPSAGVVAHLITVLCGWE